MSDDTWRDKDEWEFKPLFGDEPDDEVTDGGGRHTGDRGVDEQRFSGDEFGARDSSQRSVEADDVEADDMVTAQHDAVRGTVSRADEPLSFGGDESGEMPHWTEPATGQVPEIKPADRPPEDEQPDVWASFGSESAVWSDDRPAGSGTDDPSGQFGARGDGGVRAGDPSVPSAHPTGETTAVRQAPERISIGTDPSGMPRRPSTPSRATRAAGAADGGGRNLPIAIAVGFAIAAVFLGAILWRPVAVLILITILLGLAAVEFFDKVGEKGYRPAIIPGILAVMAAPLTAYWVGEAGLPLVLAFALMAISAGFIGSRGVEAGPLPNTSISMLGVVWIGLMGSFAVLILNLSNLANGTPWGTDTLVILALGVVANDVGAYFIGSAAGRTPLRPWISPGKTVEGLIGGSLFTIVVLMVVGITERSDTWSSTVHLILLAIVISVFAPMGDLVESMFKRNLDVKDFGTLVRGHGGVLDRFDGFLFTLPAVYYLTLVLEPWAA